MFDAKEKEEKNHFYISIDQYFMITQRFFMKVIYCKLWLEEDLLMTRYILFIIINFMGIFCVYTINVKKIIVNLVDSLM